MKSDKTVPASKQSTPNTFCKNYKLSTFPIDQLTHDLYVQLVRCNMSRWGVMQSLIKAKYKQNEPDHWLCVCTDMQDRLLGWAIAHKTPLHKRYVFDFHVYVRKKFRRQGIATDILNVCRDIAKQLDVDIHVVPHDRISRSFYIENNIPVHLWC